MKHNMAFVTTVTDAIDLVAARRLVSSIRDYAGELHKKPILVFTSLEELGPLSKDVELIKAIPPGPINNYPLGKKVFFCSLAEQELGGNFESMVYLDPYSLILRLPRAFQLDANSDVALRPVHLKNIGQPADEPLTAYWNVLFQLVGNEIPDLRVVSFVDSCLLYPYFNTHCFSIRPDLGLCERWMQSFTTAIQNNTFQQKLCTRFNHKLFLHQAIFSCLVAAEIHKERICILPPDYSYPYHLQQDVPLSLRARLMNDLTHVVYEECSLNPDKISGIEVHEPLNTWLRQNWAEPKRNNG